MFMHVILVTIACSHIKEARKPVRNEIMQDLSVAAAAIVKGERKRVLSEKKLTSNAVF